MQAQQFIYADYNATAPVPERVREAMQPYLAGQFGNPSSQHSELGRQARAAVEDARLSVAELIGAQPDEIVFTSGGTESAFAALVGAARGLSVVAGSLLLTSSVEHPAVREAASFVEETYGLEVLSIPVDRGGMLQFDAISQEALDRVALVSIMHANNESGAVFPLAEIGERFRSRGAVVHTDAVQSVAHLGLDVRELGIDLLSFSGHKLGAAKGIGALYVRRGSPWRAPMPGGGQESTRRGGTEAVALIVGFGEAARILREQQQNFASVRDSFEQQLTQLDPSSEVIAASSPRLGNTSLVVISGVDGTEVCKRMAERGVLISNGSACHSGRIEPSPVLRAMGRSDAEALGAVRVSFGCGSTSEEARVIGTLLAEEVSVLRQLARNDLQGRLVVHE